MVYTDNLDFANRYLTSTKNLRKEISKNLDLASSIISSDKKFLYKNESCEYDDFSVFSDYYFIEHSNVSQFDTINNHVPDKVFKNNLVCIAGSGNKFHGYRDRRWEAIQGNLHLSCYFKPEKEIKNFGVGFLTLPAISVVMALDDIEDLKGKSKIKWVNDILIDDAKVSGVLANSYAQGTIVKSVVIGIGLNIEKNPNIKPDVFVPKTNCLNNILQEDKKTNEKIVFTNLIRHLSDNYRILIERGYEELLEKYIERSAIIGKTVSIWSDERDGSSRHLRRGKVKKIGNNLELYLDDSEQPVLDGRLSFEEKI